MTENGSPKAVAASSKETRCFRRFADAFRESHSKRTGGGAGLDSPYSFHSPSGTIPYTLSGLPSGSVKFVERPTFPS